METNNKDQKICLHSELYFYLITLIFVLCSYSISIEFFDDRIVGNGTSTLTTSIIISTFMIPMIFFFKKSNFSLSDFGFNLKNYKENIRSSIFISICFCACLTLLKAILIRYSPLFANLTLFSRQVESIHFWMTTGIIYCAFAFLQAIMQNGFCQAPIYLLSKSPNKSLHSVLLSSLIFTFAHIDLSLAYALATIPAGLLWAILFNKQKSLIGPYISHIIIGIWSFWALNFEEIISLVSQSVQKL